jgi:hypothetical protein
MKRQSTPRQHGAIAHTRSSENLKSHLISVESSRKMSKKDTLLRDLQPSPEFNVNL